ncbi:MAG: hypothetical protein RLZZ136_1382, partial [Pseudomonadota bacterium]
SDIDEWAAVYDDGVKDGAEEERARIVAWLRHPDHPPHAATYAEAIARGDYRQPL